MKVRKWASQLVLGAPTYKERQLLKNAVDYSGFVEDTKTLVMGLDIRQGYQSNGANNNTEPFKFGDVLHLIGFCDPNDSSFTGCLPDALASLVSTISLDLNMPVVTDWKTKEDLGSDLVQALWFVPGENYNTTLRVDFVERGHVLADFLSSTLGDVTVDSVKVSAVRNSRFQAGSGVPYESSPTISAGDLCLRTSLSFTGATPSSKWEVYVNLDETSITVVLQWPGGDNPINEFLAWISDKSGIPSLSSAYHSFDAVLINWQGNADIMLHQVALTLDWSSGSRAWYRGTCNLSSRRVLP